MGALLLVLAVVFPVSEAGECIGFSWCILSDCTLWCRARHEWQYNALASWRVMVSESGECCCLCLLVLFESMVFRV